MEQRLLIRQAQEDDIPVLCDLLEELFSIESDFRIDPILHARGLKLFLEDKERCVVFVAQLVLEIIGMVTVQLNISTVQGELSGLIEDMVITKSRRGKGIGKKLMQAAQEWCCSKKVTRVQLLADITNIRALSFYKALGYGDTSMVCRRKFLS